MRSYKDTRFSIEMFKQAVWIFERPKKELKIFW